MSVFAPFSFDEKYYNDGFRFVAGVDEAGRGPLAGPVVAAAVVLPRNISIPYLNDSKKLTPKKRDELFEIIKGSSVAYSISVEDNNKIDEINILQAALAAMRNAVLGLKSMPDICLVDGNHNIPNLNINQAAIIGGDGKSAAIAAASILAKVTRDKIMCDYAVKFPQYGFDKHKGYGTKAHMDALKTYGPSPIHRKTFAPVKLCLGNFND